MVSLHPVVRSVYLSVAYTVLRYLDFHHVDTQPISADVHGRLAQSKTGLHEVSDMKALIEALDMIALKSWFRIQMGMEK